jgi:hypothetical protein
MKKYIVRYTSSTDHDSCKVWVMASCPEEAEEKARREYWDIEEIDAVYEA